MQAAERPPHRLHDASCQNRKNPEESHRALRNVLDVSQLFEHNFHNLTLRTASFILCAGQAVQKSSGIVILAVTIDQVRLPVEERVVDRGQIYDFQHLQ